MTDTVYSVDKVAPRRASQVRTVIVVLLLLFAATSAQSALQVFGTYYIPDTPFPQFEHMWHEGWQWTDDKGEPVDYAQRSMPLGGYLFVYFQNMGASPITVADLAIEGVKLSEGLGKSHDAVGDLYGHSVKLSKLSKELVDKLYSAGQPIWWKAEPREVLPKATGQIVVRLKRDPRLEKLGLAIITNNGTFSATINTKQQQPRFRGIYFTPELDTAYLYVSHPAGAGQIPNKIFLDGKNVTQLSKIGTDKNADVVPIVVKFQQPLDFMSYHCFRVGYPDGSAATAGIRAWGHELVYGMWGGSGNPRTVLTDWAKHNINVMMGQWSGDGAHISLEPGGLEFMQSIGMRQMTNWFGNARKPLFYFLQDEPDAQDYSIDDLQPIDRLGCLGQALVAKSEELRKKDNKVAILLNVDNTYKPENWYTYHQLADIPCIDPYYQGELDSCYTKHPGRMAYHHKPTYVYAASAISQSSCAPKPLHVVLCATGYSDPKSGFAGRYPTPEEKEIELCYALAAGAKGFSYWWFTPGNECNGCGGDSPEAKALYKGIGLLGARMRTAGPVTTVSCPANLSVKVSKYLWARTLISGLDTVVLIIVNDDVLCDRMGTVVKPVEKAKASVEMPSWVNTSDAFEITPDGVKDIAWKRDGSNVELDLGTVNISRLIFITSDAALRQKLTRLYEAKFAANVAALK